MDKKKLTLSEINEIVRNREFDKFYRHPNVEAKYQLEKKEAIVRIKKELNDLWKGKIRWAEKLNDYPYHFDDELEHYVVWDLESNNWDKTAEDWKGQWSKEWKYPHDDYFVSWINPPQFRSVSDIPHVHLVRRKRRQFKNTKEKLEYEKTKKRLW